MTVALTDLELYAYLSQDIYLSREDFESSWVLKDDVYGLEWHESHGITVAVLRVADTQVVVFRGTDDVLDWFRNLRAKKVERWPALPGKVHSGFSHGWNEVRRWVYQYLRTDLETVFCGHSLGGALALLAAVETARSFPVTTSSVTFGAPRVGNAEFTKSVQKLYPESHTRCVIPGDVVPRIPGVLMGYRHVGDLLYMEAGAAWNALNPPWWRKWLSVIKNWKRLLTCHSMTSYCDRLPIVWR